MLPENQSAAPPAQHRSGNTSSIYSALSTFHEIIINVVGHFNRLTYCLEYSGTSYSWEKPSGTTVKHIPSSSCMWKQADSTDLCMCYTGIA